MQHDKHIGSSAEFLSVLNNPLDSLHYVRAKLAVLMAVDYETASEFDQFGFGLSAILGEISRDLKHIDALLTAKQEAMR